jgi:hypothetical protein
MLWWKSDKYDDDEDDDDVWKSTNVWKLVRK